jgi:AcrR family transcriptional regulator
MNSYWAEGINTISLNEICRRANVSKPALYREFGNEDGLMTAALELYFKEFIAPLFKLFFTNQSFQEVLQNILFGLLFVSEKKANSIGCLFTKMRDSHDFLGSGTKNKLELLHKSLLLTYEQWIDYAKQKGNFTKQIPSAVAAVYIDSQISNINSQKARGESIQTIRGAACLAFSVLVKKPFHIN